MRPVLSLHMLPSDLPASALCMHMTHAHGSDDTYKKTTKFALGVADISRKHKKKKITL